MINRPFQTGSNVSCSNLPCINASFMHLVLNPGETERSMATEQQGCLHSLVKLLGRVERLSE